MRWPRLVSVGILALVVAMVGGCVWLLVDNQPGRGTAVAFAGLGAVGVFTTVLGALVAWRVPDNPVGVLLTWAGGMVVFFSALDVYYTCAVRDPGALPLDNRVVAVLNESPWWLFVAVALLLLYFPDGRLPSARWRFVPPALVGLCAAQQAYGAVDSQPYLAPLQEMPHAWGPPSLAVEIAGNVAFAAMLALLLASGISLVIRYRRSSGQPRAQLKWLALAGLAGVVFPFVCLAEIVITGSTGPVATVEGIAALVLLPASVAIAMLRHDLYDVDRVVADTVSYAVVVVVLLGTYALLALGLGLVVGRGSAAAAAGATAVCALLLSPLRTRLQRLVDRRLFPPRRAALAAIEDLQRRVHTQGAQPEELQSVLRTALRDPDLRVGLLVPGTTGFVDSDGVPVIDNGLVPVTLGGVQVGALGASAATGPAVLRVIATACASLVEVTRLRAELAQALREVEASRTRLVQVGDAERLRLERDLHDGAQQRLVSLGMAMRLAQRHLGNGTVDVDALLDQGVAELATAIAELRQVAHGLRPSSLEDGLPAALASLTNALPIPVLFDVCPAPLADDVATTAYYVAAEAITNAAKHANATAIRVRVTQGLGGVEVRVQDDGCGGAAPRNGSGLAGLADRVAAVGGSLQMDSPAGAGTTIEAVLPCGS